ncbi:hypothetical protein, partial [Burkholderia pseudomallei]
SVTISSSCCVGMGVFSITPLKNKNPALGEGLSAIWGGFGRPFSIVRGPRATQDRAAPAPAPRERTSRGRVV